MPFVSAETHLHCKCSAPPRRQCGLFEVSSILKTGERWGGANSHLPEGNDGAEWAWGELSDLTDSSGPHVLVFKGRWVEPVHKACEPHAVLESSLVRIVEVKTEYGLQ